MNCSSVAWLLLPSLCSESQILVPVKLSSALQRRGNLSEEDYNFASIVPSRFSQQHKYNARALYFLLNMALVRITWWDIHLGLCLLDYVILTEIAFTEVLCTSLVKIALPFAAS